MIDYGVGANYYFLDFSNLAIIRMNLILTSLLAVSGNALAAKIPGHGFEGQHCFGDNNCYSGNRCVLPTKKCIALYKGTGGSCTYDE